MCKVSAQFIKTKTYFIMLNLDLQYLWLHITHFFTLPVIVLTQHQAV